MIGFPWSLNSNGISVWCGETTKVNQKKIKSSRKEYVMLTNENYFPKTISQREFD